MSLYRNWTFYQTPLGWTFPVGKFIGQFNEVQRLANSEICGENWKFFFILNSMEVTLFMMYEDVHHFENEDPRDKINYLINLANEMFSTSLGNNPCL